MLKAIKWIIVAPLFLGGLYLVGIFSEQFREAVTGGIRNAMNELSRRLEENKDGSR